jgi:hypothetical protein
MEKGVFERLYDSINYSLNNLYVNNDDNKMSNDKQSSVKDLAYWKTNAEENYMTTPISVLKYISELEKHIETIKTQLPSNDEMVAKWMRNKIGGNNE